jgi:hypothetical protein
VSTNIQADYEWWQRRRDVYQIDAEEAARYGDADSEKIWRAAVINADEMVQKFRGYLISAK